MKPARLTSFVLVAALALLSIALWCGVARLWGLDYDGLAHALVVRAGKPHQEALFKARYYTTASHAAAKWIAAACAMAVTGLTAFSITQVRKVARCLQSCGTSALAWTSDNRARWGRLRPGTRIAIGLLLIGQSAVTLYRIAHLPVSYDEAWTYLNFTSRPLYTAVSYYPAPNNHILFSVLTVLTGSGPWSPLTSMRLISLTFTIATAVMLIGVGRRLYDERTALVGASLFLLSWPVSLYAVQARGYAMLLFFTVICFWNLSVFVAEPRRRWPLVAYSVASALGFHTIPSFLYPFASVTAVALAQSVAARRWQLVVRPLLIAGAATGVATLALYAPVLVISGLAAVVSNPDVQPMPLAIVVARLPAHLAATATWICLPVGGIALLAALAAASALLIRRTPAGQAREPSVSMLGVLLAPPLIVLVHRVIPFERTWIYLLVPICLLVMVMVDRLLAWMPDHFALPSAVWPMGAIAGVIVAAWLFERVYASDYARDFEADRLFAGFPSASVRTVISDDVYFADLLTYRLQRQRGEPIVTKRWTPGMRLDADALVLSGASVRPPIDPDAHVVWRRSGAIMVYLRQLEPAPAR